MSEILDRLRRLHGLREQKREEPSSLGRTDAPAPQPQTDTATPMRQAAQGPIPQTGGYYGAHGRPQPLDEAVPGVAIETEAGPCYVSTFAYPLDLARGAHALGTLLSHPPHILDQLVAVGVRAAERDGARLDYSQAAFIDTETSGLGTGSCCFMVGVGTFETLALAPVGEHLAQDSVAPSSGAQPLLTPAQQITPALPPTPAESTHFVVRQFFMRHPGEETALLAALATFLNPFNMTVTFNGRSFDLPLLRARYRLHRHFLPASTPSPDLLDERRVHLDLLLPARRLWRRRLQSCRLINLEQKILHLYRSEDDVPGHLIPMLYVDFTRNGDARAMRQVFYHNREDIVSMVGIAAHLNTTLTLADGATIAGRSSSRLAESATAYPTGNVGESPAQDQNADATAPEPVLHGQEWFALGKHYVKQNQPEQARTAFEQATTTLIHAPDRGLAFQELAALHKRIGDWEQACATWQLWISSVPGNDPTPYVELAKHAEWQSRDLGQAEMWTAWAIHNLKQADARSHHRSLLPELEHRLERLRRKRAGKVSA